jgi:uncharacterized protein YjiS (DUF1127 family)
MKAALILQSGSETISQTADPNGIVEPTAQISRACPALRASFWPVGGASVFILTSEAKAQWRRVRNRNTLTTLRDGDLCDMRRTRAEVEAIRCKAFWWA